ncbi:MAG: DUF192 domain-containing protein [Flavobacteriales bacterium]|jgi:uncharacterized membrane protein (UPF0127 family)|uniref:DUF192 domain-containing protein n=1 Tax=Blattabacterium sp. (Mastotermes darwiniensis) TaxID=39768 RepID=UPI000231DF2B|nr:DUF192 domain-containing protein [Blattabacterium sp. (Mastotermes darwiniensis)]AER40863.1 secreted protein containing DUF192 [Blattabacterium sp. (Mastotermes darwiniensis) str. MADAR]MDR1804710.1 DUF192 domain-containing protein [Flavobacteriales bacterium]
MNKVKILFLFLLIPFLFSSSERGENEDQLFFDIGDQLEIEFLKDGELYMKNENILIKKIDIELADRDTEKKNGLMYRSFLKEDRGLLLVLNDKEEVININMENMRIPLDIVCIDDSNTVIIVNKYVLPMKKVEKINFTGIKYVLEINAGMSDKWRIKEGITKIFVKINMDKKF